jgi:hypothetical protein
MLSKEKADFIRTEFECFVRIGRDAKARARVQKTIERILISDGAPLASISIYLEARDDAGELREMWMLETDNAQLVRLDQFLRRFSIEDVRLMESLLSA